jgi:uncharacterized membrane protein
VQKHKEGGGLTGLVKMGIPLFGYLWTVGAIGAVVLDVSFFFFFFF